MTERKQWDLGADTWDEMINDERSPHFHYYRTIDMLVVELLRGVQARRALEVGCGTGGCLLYVLQELADWEDLQLVGVDFSSRMIEIAQQKVDKTGLGDRVSLEVGDATELSYPQGHFDAVFSRGAILSYVRYPKKLLHSIHGVLRNDGVIGLDVLPKPPAGKSYYILRAPELQQGILSSNLTTLTVHEFFTQGRFQVSRKYQVHRDTRLFKELVRKFQKLPDYQPGLTDRPEHLGEGELDNEEKVRLYTIKEAELVFRKVGFESIKIYGAGYSLRLLKDEILRPFVNQHRDVFSRVEILLNDLINLQYATMLFITGRKTV